MDWYYRQKEWLRQVDSFDKRILKFNAFLILVVFVSVFFYFFMFQGGFSSKQTDWGMFGDFTGGFGGMLISLVAVLLIFITYRLQQKELKATNEALETQNSQMKIQQFQNVLFKLLERKDQLIGDLAHKRKTGIEALGNMTHSFRHKIKNNDLSREDALKEFWINYKSRLTAFLNVFVSTVKYLDSFDTSNSKEYKIKEQLIGLYSSNLSTKEKYTLNLIIEYYQIHEPENVKINFCRRIIEDWNILKSE